MNDPSEHAAVASPLLATKLFVPRGREGQVARQEQLQRLVQGARHKLTLLSAPAGFGKTSLLGAWAQTLDHGGVAWVSLDAGDNDPNRFWRYVSAAIERVEPGMGMGAASLLQSSQSAPLETLITTLINDIGNRSSGITLVLDDYHVISEQSIHDSIEFLLDNAPANLHLVIASRSDPPFPLSRLRARRELTEIRAADLRFTADETATFLGDSMGLDITSADVDTLNNRTEGWIAGIQLAALSMQSRDDAHTFISDFAGDDRYIVDYLVEEVLRHQPEAVRSFLLQTSILDRLSGPLCDAVTGMTNGDEQLRTLDRANLFLTPLDTRREWYRYHHLFAEVLSVHLKAERPQEIAALHARASRWFGGQGLFAEAIQHATAAGDIEQTADLIELAGPEMRRGREEVTLLHWHMSLPESVVSRRPVLCMDYAFTLLSTGQIDAAQRWLQAAEEWVGSAEHGQTDTMVVADTNAWERLAGSVAIARAGMSLGLNDLAAAATWARRALGLLQPDDHFWRGAGSAILGLVAWADGDIEPAGELYSQGMTSLQKAGYVTDAIGGSAGLGDIQVCQGALSQAKTTYERSLQLAVDEGVPAMRGTADIHVGLSELAFEQNDLDLAMHHLHIASEQGDHTGFPQFQWRWRAASAQIEVARRRFDQALELLQQAEECYVSDFHPDYRPIASRRVRVWLAQDRLDEALTWSGQPASRTASNFRFVDEYELATRARVLIAWHMRGHKTDAIREAIELLDVLLEQARRTKRYGSVIELGVTLALAHQAVGETGKALEYLQLAMKLGQPEGYVRVFIDEGDPMRTLLRIAASRGIAADCARDLLSQFDVSLPANVTGAKPLVEALTSRELEILRLISTGMKNDEIADHLFISTATVKRHIANAYGKLGVNQRSGAIARAQELNLL